MNNTLLTSKAEAAIENTGIDAVELSNDDLQLASAGLNLFLAASLASSSLSIYNGACACKNNSQRTSGF